MNSIIIPAVRLNQIAATTGADLINFVFKILNICFLGLCEKGFYLGPLSVILLSFSLKSPFRPCLFANKGH